MEICLLSSEAVFAHMLAAELRDAGHTVILRKSAAHLPAAAAYVIDADAFPDARPPARTVCYSRTPAPGVLHRPFALSAFLAAVMGEEIPRTLTLLSNGVLLAGVHIPLTAREHALLACLLAAEGKPVSKETLFTTVWGGKGDRGVVPVYLHYLRKKLERGGRKMLYAVRGRGYALRGEEDAP